MTPLSTLSSLFQGSVPLSMWWIFSFFRPPNDYFSTVPLVAHTPLYPSAIYCFNGSFLSVLGNAFFFPGLASPFNQIFVLDAYSYPAPAHTHYHTLWLTSNTSTSQRHETPLPVPPSPFSYWFPPQFFSCEPQRVLHVPVLPFYIWIAPRIFFRSILLILLLPRSPFSPVGLIPSI